MPVFNILSYLTSSLYILFIKPNNVSDVNDVSNVSDCNEDDYVVIDYNKTVIVSTDILVNKCPDVFNTLFGLKEIPEVSPDEANKLTSTKNVKTWSDWKQYWKYCHAYAYIERNEIENTNNLLLHKMLGAIILLKVILSKPQDVSTPELIKFKDDYSQLLYVISNSYSFLNIHEELLETLLYYIGKINYILLHERGINVSPTYFYEVEI